MPRRISERFKIGCKRSRRQEVHPEEIGGYKNTMTFQSTAQSIRAAVPAAGGKTTTILKNYKMSFFAVSSGQSWPGGPFQYYFAGKKYYGGRESPQFL